MTIFRTLSKIKTFSAAALISILFLSSVGQTQKLCLDQLSGVSSESTSHFVISKKGSIKVSPKIGELFIDTATSQLNSTTGNRTELKRTVLIEKLSLALEKLSQTFPLKPRDTIKAGTKNVTVTQYLNILKFDYKGQELSVKIRFRKYGTMRTGLPNIPENVQFIPEMKDVSFLEFKIDHPDFDNSVLKPRGLQLDSDIQMIGTPQFLAQFEQILERAVGRNSKNIDSIQTMTKMQNLLKYLHEVGVPLQKDSRTIYERTSYALPAKNIETNAEHEIQITIDEGILIYSYPHDKTIDAYQSEKPLAVVELKIPVEMIDNRTKSFSDQFLQLVPALKKIQAFLDDLTSAQAPGFDMNKGKQSRIKTMLENNEE